MEGQHIRGSGSAGRSLWPNADGLRKDVLESPGKLGHRAAGRRGGWHAASYRREDGPGPREQTPVRLNTDGWDSQKGRYWRLGNEIEAGYGVFGVRPRDWQSDA